MSTDYPIIVYCTAPIDVAPQLARTLLTEKLVACVNIVPKVTSMYWWQGKIEEDNEALMIIKTDNRKMDQLKEVINKEHPYDVPEIISFKIDDGNKPYLDWIQSSIAR